MTIRNSQAKQAFWQQFSAEQKSAILSLRARKMWKAKTKAQKQERAYLMLKAKANKRKQQEDNRLSTP